MASQAEVDLVISTAGALPELERDLDRILRIAENDADSVDVNVGINASRSLAQLDAEITSVINRVEGDVDGVQVGVLIDQREAIRTIRRQVDQVVRSVDGSGVDPVTVQGVLDSAQTLRTVRAELNRVAADVQRDIDPIRVDVDVDRGALRDTDRRLTDFARSAGQAALSVGRLGVSAGAAGLALGGLLPVLAGVAAAAQQVAPAAAVAVSGMLAIQLAAGTTRLAMIGVGEAIEAAFDPETKPEELEKALKRLAPEARKFVVELRGMRKELGQVQQEVQNRFFQDFDETLETTARNTLPTLRRGLNDTATILNTMARGAANAAGELGRNGTLGVAVDGATKGLENLSGVPARIVTALGQLAAASAPALDKLTRRIDTATAEIAEKLEKAFDSGALEEDIDAAISAIGQLARVGGNLLGGLRNIFAGLTTDGGGLFDILEKISQAFEDLTASEEFQTILGEISKTADKLVETVLPLLAEAFRQLAPVIAELGPPLREFIEKIAPDLKKVVEDLGPVLLDIALILKENLPLGIRLAKGALQLLSLALEFLHFILETIVLPAARKVSQFLESDFVRSFRGVANVISLVALTFSRKIPEIVAVISTGFGRARQILGDFVANLNSRIAGGVITFVATTVRNVSELPQRIANVFRSLGPQLFGIGADIMRGLINGILSQVSRLLGIARNIANSITSTIKGALDSSSPSKVMIGVGEDIDEGLIIGMKRLIPQIMNAAESVAGVIAPSFALPNGESLPISPINVGPQPVNVFIGNQQLNPFIDTRINANNRARDRVLSQGVRR